MTSRRDLVIAVGLAVVCAVVWAPIWTGRSTFFAQDVAAYFYPMKALLADAVRSGEWPWWNPWIRNGLPFYANPQVGLFYPPTWAFLVLPLALAFNWVVILHVAVLATGIYAWLRAEGRSPAAALVGAVAVAFGGYAVSMINYLNNLQALAWIGWILWAWRGWLDGRSVRWVAILAVGFALQFLGGEPLLPIVTAALALGWAWVKPSARAADGPVASGGGRWAAPALALAAAGVAAVVLTAVQLVPTAELFARSARRGQGLATGEILTWSLEPLQTANLVLPRYFDGPEGLFDLRRLPMASHPWVFTSYLGVVAFVLAACAPLRRAPREVGWWLAVCALGVLLALGGHVPPVAWVVERMPGAGLFRYPERLLVLPAIGLPVLAARGLDALREDRRHAGVAVGIGLAALAGLAAWAIDLEVVAGLVAGWPERVGEHRDPRWILEGLRSGFLHVAVFSLLAAGAVAARRWLRPEVVDAGLVVLVAVDLAIVNPDAAPLAPSRLYRQQPEVLDPLPVAELRTEHRVRTTPLGAEVGEWFVVPGITLATQQTFLFRTMGPNLSMMHRVLAEDGAEAFRPRRDDARSEILRELPPPMQVRLLRLASTAYLYERPIRLEGIERMPGGPILGLHPYRVVDPLPRAYLVQRAVVEPDSLAILNRFVAGGEDPRRIAYVAGGPALDGPAEPVDGSVRWVESGDRAVELDVDTPVPALLVLTDSHYPGWTVEVDGQRAALRRVNWFFQGVRLEPGRHRVRFAYRPRWIVPAGVASLVGLLAVGLAIVRGGRRGA